MNSQLDNLDRDQALNAKSHTKSALKLNELWNSRTEKDYLSAGKLFLQHLSISVLYLLRSRVTSSLNIFCIATLLFVLGLLLSFQNTDFFGKSLNQEKIELAVFVKDSATEQDWKDLEKIASGLPAVLDSRRTNKKFALDQLKARFGTESELFVGLEQDNPLPASLELSFEAKASAKLEEYANQFRTNQAVEAVSYDGEIAQVFSKLAGAIKKPGKFTTLALILLTIFLISSTVRLSMFHQQQQIEIMTLVGASSNFVKAPFLIGAILQALLASILAVCALVLLNNSWHKLLSANEAIQNLSINVSLVSLPVVSALLIVALGSALLGSYLSARIK